MSVNRDTEFLTLKLTSITLPQFLSIIAMGWALFVFNNTGVRESEVIICSLFLMAIVLGMLLFVQLGAFGCQLLDKHPQLIISAVIVWVVFFLFTVLSLLVALTQSGRMPAPQNF